MRKKVIIVYSIAFSLAIGITLLALLVNNDKVDQTIIQPTIQPEEINENKIVESKEEIIKETKNPKTKVSSSSLGGGGSGGGSKSTESGTNFAEQPDIPICPPDLAISYTVSEKSTVTTEDDQVFIVITNNKPKDEKIELIIDENSEGEHIIKSLATEYIESNIITSWWTTLLLEESKSFEITIIPENCQTISEILNIIYSQEGLEYDD